MPRARTTHCASDVPAKHRPASRENIRPTVLPTKRPALRLIQPDRASDVLPQPAVKLARALHTHDAAAAIGLDPFTSTVRLWMDKTGRPSLSEPTGVHNDSPTFWTRLLDPIVAACYTRCTGQRVRRTNAMVRHPEHPWMVANVDREVIDQGDVQLLSYLFVGRHGASAWAEGMPDHVHIQALHNLAVTGHHAIDLAVLMCGEELQIHRVEREEAVIARLIALEGSFWRHVELDLMPPAEGFLAADVVRRVLCARGRRAVSLRHRLTTGNPFELKQ